MKVVMWVHVPHYRDAVLDRIRDTPGLDLVVVDNPEAVPAALVDAEGMISAGASIYTPELERAIRNSPKLRWFQSVAAGNDNMEKLGIRDGIVVTGSGGHSGPVVAEHAIALLLAIAHAVPDWERAKAAGQWKPPRTGVFTSMYRRTAVVVGLGHIGREIVRRLKGLDMTVLGVSRSGAGAQGVDEAFPTSELKAALARADAVLLAAPLTAESRGLMGAAEFEACKPGALFVNVARGGLVDHVALQQALESGRLGGAAIDVTDPEPLPAGHPLWKTPNLIISPHVAGGGSGESVKRLAEAVNANLQAFLHGGAFTNLLPYGRP